MLNLFRTNFQIRQYITIAHIRHDLLHLRIFPLACRPITVLITILRVFDAKSSTQM